MSELKPCPFCGATNVRVKCIEEFTYSVKCHQCAAFGPDAPSTADAVTRCNDCTARSPTLTKTLRDEFAMAALTGLEASLGADVEIPPDKAAQYAYARAASMMKEREKADE